MLASFKIRHSNFTSIKMRSSSFIRILIFGTYIIGITALLVTFIWLKILDRHPISQASSSRRIESPVITTTMAPPTMSTHGYSMEMVIRMSSISKLISELYCSMFRSAVLFWSPKLANITLVFDEESKADQAFVSRFKKQDHFGFDVKILFEPLPKDRRVMRLRKTRTGYLRQLWSSFFIDTYTKAEIIAWMDSDAMFSTPVTPENIFNGNKLRVLGGAMWHPVHFLWSKATKIAIGRRNVGNFMSHFPTYVWRDTVSNCRNYIMKHLNVSSFADAFKIIHSPPAYRVSPVCVILTYAYYFEHDRYDWHLDTDNFNSLADFNKNITEPGFEVQPGDISPDIHVTIHAKHYEMEPRDITIKRGYCVVKHIVDKLPSDCEKFNDTINFQLFDFDCTRNWEYYTNHLNTWCKPGEGHQRCVVIIQKHYQNVKKYYNYGHFDFDLQRVLKVEMEAKKEKITCPKLFKFP